jgi:DNA polymerase III subunit beta
MDIVINRNDLARALSLTQNIVEKRTTMPILGNVLLSATDGKLKISASDLEITAVAISNAQINSPGSTTVSAKMLSDLVRELGEGDVRLKLTEGERIEITSQKSKFKIVGVSADEYPSLPGISFKTKGRIGSKTLLEMINKTIYSVSQDETRFNLNGVCFEMVSEGGKKNKLRMVSTDGHRLSMITREVEDFSFKDRVIVPRKGLNELKKVVESENDTEIGIDINDGFLVIESKDCKVSMRLIDAEYPDYTQVIPKTKGTKASLSGESLSRAVRRVALLVTDKGKCIRFDFSKDALRINSSSPELGEASEEVTIKYEGKPISIGFNARYVVDFIASVGESQEIIMELNGDLGPGKVYTEGDESYFGIIMPMRLAN